MKFKNFIWLFSVLVTVLAVIFLVRYQSAKANPSSFIHNQTNVSTAVVDYLIPKGAGDQATTTISSFLTGEADEVNIIVQITPSSTSAIVEVWVDHSINGTDWGNTTGTPLLIHNDNWDLNTGTTTDIVTVPVVAEFMRVRIAPKIGSANVSIWADAILHIQKP